MLLGDDEPLAGQQPGGAQVERPPRALGAARPAGQRHRRAERGGQPGHRRLELGAALGRAGIGDEGEHARRAAVGEQALRALQRRGDRARAEPAGQPLGVDPLGDERRDLRRRAPAGAHGGGAHVLRRGRRVGGEQEDEARAAALALAGGGRLLGGVALDRLAGDLVDVGEDRLAEAVEDRRLEVRAHAGLDEPPPRDLRADAVGGEQRVERAALAHLQAAELEVDAPVALADGGRRLDRVHEAAQRALGAVAQRHAEAPLQRPRVVGHLAADRADRLGGEVGEDRAQYRCYCGGNSFHLCITYSFRRP